MDKMDNPPTDIVLKAPHPPSIILLASLSDPNGKVQE